MGAAHGIFALVAFHLPEKNHKPMVKKPIGLEPIEPIRLVEAILSSLDKPDRDVEQSWIAESEALYEACKRGGLDAIDWEGIKNGNRAIRAAAFHA